MSRFLWRKILPEYKYAVTLDTRVGTKNLFLQFQGDLQTNVWLECQNTSRNIEKSKHKLMIYYLFELCLCSLRGQTAHSVYWTGFRISPKSDLLQNPPLRYFSLIFLAVLDSRNKYLITVPLKISPKKRVCGIRNFLRNQKKNKTAHFKAKP